ncbi:MAG: hypothetical protein M1817_006647 [Caeruleum heppii]|nr:MAG: hypothetical protein M1817_006647 [Caeruleum heppii]
MSKVVKKFGEFILNSGILKKVFANQSAGRRIAPTQSGNNDEAMELRLDAGETIDGKKTVYLQVNAQAKNESLKKFSRKHGTHANLAVATVDPNTPKDQQVDVFKEIWENVEEQAMDQLR